MEYLEGESGYVGLIHPLATQHEQRTDDTDDTVDLIDGLGTEKSSATVDDPIDSLLFFCGLVLPLEFHLL
jgi:hypothetical protein